MRESPFAYEVIIILASLLGRTPIKSGLRSLYGL
jgi:hypothetical protein